MEISHCVLFDVEVELSSIVFSETEIDISVSENTVESSSTSTLNKTEYETSTYHK